MGLFDFVKDAGQKLFGGGEKANTEAALNLKSLVTGMGIPVEGLDIDVDDDLATIKGVAPTQADREKVVLLVGNVNGISKVDDRMTLAPEPPAVFYTVVSGDSLSKIAKAHYGDPRSTRSSSRPTGRCSSTRTRSTRARCCASPPSSRRSWRRSGQELTGRDATRRQGMNLLETLLNAGDGGVVKEIAKGLSLGEDDARKGVNALAPALARGMSRNTRQEGGLEALLGALAGGNHQQYVDEPQRLAQPESIADGNAILGHILGSKDVSRNVAGHAAQETGMDAGILKKMLPMVAAAAMGSMSKKTTSAAPAGGLSGLLGGLMGGGGQQKDAGMAGIVEGFLDSDSDGAVVDDLLDMAKKFF